MTPHIALVGNPNAGKSSLFNALTGSRQKVANYPGVTVERHSGMATLPDGRTAELIDLPGTYSLDAKSPDEVVTCEAVMGAFAGERRPDVIICVVDATNLTNHLKFVLELCDVGLPLVVALNMIDLAERDGTEIDVAGLARELGVPVVPTVAVRKRGLLEVLAAAASLIPPPLEGEGDRRAASLRDGGEVTLPELAPAPSLSNPSTILAKQAQQWSPSPSSGVGIKDIRAYQNEARTILRKVILSEGQARSITRHIDDIVLHPIFGLAILAMLLFIIFQAVFSWAQAPMALINDGFSHLQVWVSYIVPAGLLRSLISDGIIAGVGSVVVFLPQIVILFFFILLLEQTGYMTRAAFLMDQIMAKVGLNGRAFIPLLSSFACAVPGIMSARTIDNPRDRLTTIMIAPLMTCSARLPVYAVIIAAFIPATTVHGVGLQGLVLFALYLVGIISAFVVAFVLRRTLTRGAAQPLIMEMPKYQWPPLRDIIMGLWQRAMIFLKRAGTIILGSMIVLWVLSHIPISHFDMAPDLDHSIVGWIGNGLAVVFAPIGFNREICIALVPGMAAREVAVGALGQVYALQGGKDAIAGSLVQVLHHAWSLPTALAFLAWYVFAPQCISTIAVTKRETGGWTWPSIMFGYMFVMAYVGAGVTYWVAKALLS